MLLKTVTKKVYNFVGTGDAVQWCYGQQIFEVTGAPFPWNVNFMVQKHRILQCVSQINKTGKVHVTYIEALSCNHCCIGKVISVTRSECVFVAEVSSMKCACAIFQSMACPAIQYFSKFFINGTTLEQKLLKIVGVFWFYLQLPSETFLILRRNEWGMKKCVLVFI